ncbi:Uncharacterised protein [Burkholderia pseudomallei]|uniref:hypothetical protein n=1 Tax=Burkholderia pseudomallei TaxID=28450 RepID=UPI000F080895|nr:hypothetical protein [Burkholderia pseudomallei]CAJ3124729.1 Uncharacterised protein [Burkholderia pseudomallei]VCG58837.1 Uncharacterised protein [Burkholderia pseudomallei]VCG85723.1 Uncharacterised protein [Burkholderia pseudomallei]VCG85882.1 Uncharacterised protein [Burkholderia pseudomallei]VCH02598.1 Uncharacterised protein [Burkholderia pseudomallei]
MTTTDKSRADALTDDQFEDWLLPLLIKHLDSKARHYLTREQVRDGIEVTRVTTYAMNLARAILGEFPASQPAAAPIDEDAEIPPIMYNGDTKRDPALRELLNRQVKRHVLSNPRGDAPAPSPADERAALPEDRIDWIANTHCPGGTAYPVNVKNAIREALREARISDNETGAEGAIVGAWLTEDGRAISAEQKAGMLRDGGAGASSVQPYSIPCYLGAASAMAAEAVAFEITEQAAAEWASRHDVDHVLKHFSTQRNAIEDARTLHLLAAAPQPAQAGARVGLTDAARDVLDERHRQIYAEGWTPAHDDQHDECEMALAAIVYAESAVGYHPSCPDTWPWSPKWFKPTTPRRDLVKAGALILAELERLDRAALLNGADHDQ